MKNRLLKIYLLTIAILTLVLIDTTVENRVRQLISDDSRLSFHYENNTQPDTIVTLINMADYPMDTIRKWTKRIFEFKPKVVAVDNFSDTLSNTDRIDGSIILPIISDDGNYFEFSTNNITTKQTYGVALIDDYFRMIKFFNVDSVKLPSLAIQIIKEYRPDKYAEIIKTENQELINYLPTSSFIIIDNLEDCSVEFLKSLRDKIVIFGYLGYSITHTPDILDNNDSHLTPIGKMYGPIIVANQVQTLLKNRLNELSRPIIILISLITLVLTFFLIQRIKSNRWLLIIISLNLVLVLLIGLLAFASMLILASYNFFVSIEVIALSLTLGFQTGIIAKLIEN